MATKTRRPNRTMQAWIDARQRHSLSHAQVQMARGLGINPANRLVKHYECLTCSHTWQQPNHPESPAGWRMVEDEHKCVACRATHQAAAWYARKSPQGVREYLCRAEYDRYPDKARWIQEFPRRDG